MGRSWHDLSEEERHRAEGIISGVRKRIRDAYGTRGFLWYYDRAEALLAQLEGEFPEAKEITTKGEDIRIDALTKLLKVMYLRYGKAEFAPKALEWLRDHGEPVPEIEFRIKGDEEIEYERQLYGKIAEWIVEEESLEGKDYVVQTGRLANPIKWGNPDVVIIQRIAGRPDRIIVAEVKNSQEARNLFEGFGQACAYKIFSHVQYLVVPMPEDRRIYDQLKKLCAKVQVKFAVFTFEGTEKTLDSIKIELKEGGKGEPPDTEAMYEFLQKLGVEQ